MVDLEGNVEVPCSDRFYSGNVLAHYNVSAKEILLCYLVCIEILLILGLQHDF